MQLFYFVLGRERVDLGVKQLVGHKYKEDVHLWGGKDLRKRTLSENCTVIKDVDDRNKINI